MIFDIVTIFPEMFSGVFSFGIVKRAAERGLISIRVHDLRQFADDPRSVDDRPYGGGEGMVLKPEPIFRAVEHIIVQSPNAPRSIVLLTPQGRVLTQADVRRLACLRQLILICGRYEGVDHRVVDFLVDEEISIGDYILTGGEIPAMVVVDAVTRLLPGALGKPLSAVEESFERGILDYPQYTRPANFRGMTVPEVLLSGDHRRIREWRERMAYERTLRNRPDLLDKALKNSRQR